MKIGPAQLKLIAAFAAVYVIWGSTYLAIRFAIETLPPLLMAGVRFTVAGVVLLAVLRLRGAAWPARGEWLGAGVTGLLLLGVGNGGVTWAEQSVPSSIAALIASAVPLWMALMDWARPGGTRPSAATLCGVVLGLAGLVVLIGPSPVPGTLSADALGVGVMIVASLAWAAGSVLTRFVRLPSSPMTTTSLQMLAGGGALLLLGLFSGELAAWDAARVSARSVAALAYLVVFGSWIGFGAYVWLLRATTPARASTYAFVNPVVAVLLGAWLAAEPVGPRTVLAMCIIVSAVALIVFGRAGIPGTTTPVRGGWAARVRAGRGPRAVDPRAGVGPVAPFGSAK